MKKVHFRFHILFIISYFVMLNSYCQSCFRESFKIDHVLIAVSNLDSAKAAYEKCGFTVVYGGPADKALNALIFLNDGSAIELIGQDRMPGIFTILNKLRLTRLFGPMKDRITAFRSVPVGLFNYSIYSRNLSGTYQNLKQNGIRVSKPKTLSRLREDGTKIEWQLVGSSPYDLPFLIGDYSPTRISNSAYAHHQNGAETLDSIVIATSNFEKYYRLYNLIYHQVPEINWCQTQRISTYHLASQSVLLKEISVVQQVFTSHDESSPLQIFVNCGENKHTINDPVNV